MNTADLSFTAYVALFVVSLFISYFYAVFFGKKTGKLGVHTIVAFALNFILGIAIITGWSFLAWGNEFLVIAGFVVGGSLLLICEVALIILLFIKRRRYSD